jgi:hypothetical protein
MSNSDEKSSEFSSVTFAIAEHSVHCAAVRVVSVIKQGVAKGVDESIVSSRLTDLLVKVDGCSATPVRQGATVDRCWPL